MRPGRPAEPLSVRLILKREGHIRRWMVEKRGDDAVTCTGSFPIINEGEVLDLDALTGGFNLQIAWSTGFLAGKSCSEYLDEIKGEGK